MIIMSVFITALLVAFKEPSSAAPTPILVVITRTAKRGFSSGYGTSLDCSALRFAVMPLWTIICILCFAIGRIASRNGQTRKSRYVGASSFRNVLLDWTGRELRQDKRGAIPEDLAPILDRLGVDRSNWVQTVREFGRMFKQAAGRASSLVQAAPRCSRLWFQGKAAAQAAFLWVSCSLTRESLWQPQAHGSIDFRPASVVAMGDAVIDELPLFILGGYQQPTVQEPPAIRTGLF
jgi:hypothetical protein